MHKYKLILLLLSVPALSFGQSDVEKVKKTVDQSTIRDHIYYLASDELRGRETGTLGIKKAADYLAEQLRNYGVQAVPGALDGHFQEVRLQSKTPAKKLEVVINGKSFADGDLVLLAGGNIEKEKEAIFLNYGLPEDYKGKSVKGKIIIAKAGAPGQTDRGSLMKLATNKRKLAQQAQAVGLIELHTFDPGYWKAISAYLSHEKMTIAKGMEEQDGIPHVWGNNNSDLLNKIGLGDAVETRLEIKGVNSKKIISRNIVGIVEGTDPRLKKEYVIYAAHYDHVGVGEPNAEADSIYNGARDNAVGTVTVLSAAENIAKYPTKRSALFIFFTAEEKGLLGSQWYVENPLIPLEQSVYCFNSDNASYNDTTKATIVGLERTTASGNIKKACEAFGLTAIDDPAPEQNLFDRSDNVHFALKGIPAPTFSLGFTAFDEEVFKYYHQVTDNPETLNYDYLLKFFQSYVLSCRNIANDEVTPVWVEGDKYYQAGQELYGW